MLKYVYCIFLCLVFLDFSKAIAQKDDKSIYSLRQELRTVTNNGDKLVILDRFSEALLYADALQSLEEAEKMFELAKAMNDKNSESKALINISKASFLVNNYQRAEEAANSALKISQEYDLKANETQALIVLSQSQFVKNPQLSEDNLQKAIQLSEDNNFPSSEAEAYRVLGLIKQSYNQSSKAQEYLEKSIQVYKSQGNLAETARTLEFFGDTKMGEEAGQIYVEALDWAVKAEEKRLMMSLLNRLGNNKTPAQEALKYYFQGFIIGQEYDFLQNGKLLANSLKGIEETYQALGIEENNPQRKKEYEILSKRYVELLEFLRNNNYDVEKFRAKLIEEKKQENNITKPQNISQNTQNQLRLLQLQNQKLLIDTQEKNNQISILEAAEARAKLRNEEDSLRLLQKNREIENLKSQQKDQNKSIENLKASNEEKDKKIKARKRGSWLWWLLLILGVLLALLLLFWLRRRYHKRFRNSEDTNRHLKEEVQNQKAVIFNRESELKEVNQENKLLTEILDKEVRPSLEQIIVDSSSNINRLVIHQSGQQMLNLVNNVVDIHKLQGAKINLYQQAHSLYKITLEVLSQVSELLKKAQLNVENQIDPFLYVNCDKELLHRVFLSFIQNTLKYTETGGNIIITAQAKENSEKVEISYADDVKAIPSEYLGEVFEKQPSIEARPSGLGMLFAKIVIEAHQEKIDVNSENNKSYFIFTLAIAEEKPHEAEEKLLSLDFDFSAEEKELLKPYAERLKTLEIYETTALRTIINSIETQGNENIEKWKKMLEESVFFLENEKYQQLIHKVIE